MIPARGVYRLCIDMSTHRHMDTGLYTMMDAPMCAHTGSQTYVSRHKQPHLGSDSFCKHLLSLIHVLYLS